MLTNEFDRYGSAGVSDYRAIKKGGFFTQHANSVFVGFFNGKPLWYSGMGGLITVAGARSGKLRDFLAYNICTGICLTTLFILDLKGELAAISQNQTADGKFNIFWNPTGMHGLASMRINPVGHLTIHNPILVSDVKVVCEHLIPDSGSAQGKFFEGRAREFLEALILTLVRKNGVLTLPDLYWAINLIPGGGEEWLDFAFEMSEAGFPLSARIEEEIAQSREDQSGGFRGILGEVFRAVAPLSDPILMQSVSAPFDFDLGDPCQGKQAYQVYFMIPAEFVSAWSGVTKLMFVCAMAHKSRNPQARQQTFVLDECAQLGGFPMVTKLFTYGAGIGIRPLAVFQDLGQIKSISPGAETIIPSSAACRLFFAIRDIQSATLISRMLGSQTLQFDDEAAQARAAHAKHQATQAFLGSGDPLSAGLSYAHHKREAERKSKMHRLLRTPDEVMSTPDDKAFLYLDGLQHPVYADRTPYWTQKFMAGRFHPNPYHPPLDTVSVMTTWGMRTRRIVREPVLRQFAHYPQYANGIWSRVER